MPGGGHGDVSLEQRGKALEIRPAEEVGRDLVLIGPPDVENDRVGFRALFDEAGKSGAAGGPVDPEDKVDGRKQRRIGKTAAAYLLKTGADPSGCRFDVVSVVRDGDRTEIRHIEDAFWLES